MKKDNRIELYRILFTCIIVIFHGHNVNGGLGHPIPLGYVFVEFFFFLTGYFTYVHVRNEKCDLSNEIRYPFEYTLDKIKKLFPYMIMTAIPYYLIGIILKYFIECESWKSIFNDYSGVLFDLLLLQTTGVCVNPHFNAWWYLSSLLFVLPIIVILFKKTSVSELGRWFMYFAPVIIYGWFSTNVHGLDWDTSLGIFRTGLLRAFAGLCVGGDIYCISQNISSKSYGNIKKIALTIIECIDFSIAILIAWKYPTLNNSTFIIVALLISGLIIAFSNQSYTVRLNKRIFGKIGEVAAPLYICHYSVGRIVGKIMDFTDVSLTARYVAYYSTVIMMSVMMLEINKRLKGKVYEYSR